MPLVIVESPAKCSKIKGFLGPGYDVIASMGHIRALEEGLDAIGTERDFEPRYSFQKEKAKTIAAIKDAAKKHTEIILAADDDREGEAIAYSVCVLLKLDPLKNKRAVFHEITKPAVLAAIQNPRILDMNKVNSQQSRAVLDMLIGYSISPLLWNHVSHGLSAGRCQTPALRLVEERELEATNFSSTCSWLVDGQWSKGSYNFEGNLTDELQDMDSAEAYLEMRKDDLGATVLSTVVRQTSEQPPKPLITSSLQQQASSLLHIGPRDTMKIAQRLYEAGHITYMRTDRAALGEEAVKEGSAYILENHGKEYLGQSKKGTTATATNAQEAHEAIRPTHFEIKDLPEGEDWSAKDRKLYRIIWTRALQSLMSPKKGEKCIVEFRANKDDSDWTWRSSWTRTIFEGWRILNWKDIDEDKDEKDALEEEWLAATKIKEGDKLQWQTLKAAPHYTKAPGRFSEATLIKELEENGIGRPSTFASLISTILDKAYVEKKSFEAKSVNVDILTLEKGKNIVKNQKEMKQGGEKDRLVPTALGKSVLTYLLANFQDLFAYKFTAEMESRLDKIAEGQEPWKKVVKDTWLSYKSRYEAQLAIKKSSEEKSSQFRKELGENIVAIIIKKGPLLLKESDDKDKTKTIFYGWPVAVKFEDMTLEKAKTFIASTEKTKLGEMLGTIDDKEVLKKKGPYGFYVEYDGKKVSCKEESTFEEVKELLEKQAENPSKRIGQFEIKKGPYGLYMYKWANPKKEFVSVSAGTNIDELTEGGCIALFQFGLQQKAKSKAYGSGPGRGRNEGSANRGRGRGRGRGRP
jgi:DNA topoisomerase-1